MNTHCIDGVVGIEISVQTHYYHLAAAKVLFNEHTLWNIQSYILWMKSKTLYIPHVLIKLIIITYLINACMFVFVEWLYIIIQILYQIN